MSLFALRPRAGDVWEVRVPGKRKKTKTVWFVFSRSYYDARDQIVQRPTVAWKRRPRGRYTQMRVKHLLKYGRLVKRGDR